MHKKIATIVGVTLLLSGRAMTLFFIGDAGSGTEGAAPDAWLMPLIGDATIGLSALLVAWLLVYKKHFYTWLVAIVWNALGIWDALSAYIIHQTNPWPDFFMIEVFGSSMFFMASAMHGLLIYLLLQKDTKKVFSAS